jgi:hypothetical protein
MAVGAPAAKADLVERLARLRKAAQGRNTIDVAQFQFVGLNDIQQAYGERWPEQKARIQDTAEGFLRRRIGESDILIRGDGGFVVVLGAAAGPEAHAVAAQLTHGLNAFFLGAGQPSPAPQFGGGARTIAVKDIETSFGDLDVITPTRETGPAETFGLPELEWRFEPMWDVRREVLSYWYVTPYVKATGARLPGYQFENVAAHPNQFVKIDEAGLWVAEQALQELLAAERQTLIGATVHIGTLANLASRSRFLATIDRLDPDLHRYRILRIAGMAPGFPRLYLNEIVGVLRSRLPNIIIGAAWDEPDLGGLLQPGPIAVGISVPASAVSSSPAIAIPALMTKISEGVRIAHGVRSRFFVDGAVTKYLALKFAAAGVDNIASQRIWPARPMADGVLKWPADGLAAA